MDDEEEAKLSEMQKIEMAKWFLVNSPPGEIQYVAKDIRSVLMDERMYAKATLEAFPLHNKFHMISLEMPNRSGQVIVTEFSELDETHYLDPRTAQVATVNHVKQVCTEVRPAADVELASVYVEEFRFALDNELSKYVDEAYPKGECSVYCTAGKDVEGDGSNFELTAVISVAKYSPQNFCNGCWRSVWKIDFKDDVQAVELNGKLGVVSHYFEEGNVQLDTCYECKESIAMQTPEECASSITSIIRHHESEYLASLEESYSKLSDTTFKVFQDLMELRRKLPVTRTLFPWNNTLQLSFTRDLTKELGLGK
ncbi:F-actin-capping protein subunit alpha isoform X1 [Cryptomeria japonica]|uniref:F-actin-capping protein subunit alpha isoform X1 n=1 Tax=Cryptomeria japonica TaxID=3369 RepID=UPI0025AD050B|nr:F-actin-capping protein subunit alpha isoform X1 [Cryptomeria japonica]XP_057867134.1 F-actin-capping protein subunit alpha isoform X1 [Cryptomeria japonica]